MPPLSPLVFVPLSMQSGAIIARIEEAAHAQGKTVEVVHDKATDELVASRSADITVYQIIDFEQMTTRGPQWTVVPPTKMDSCIAFYRVVQPDLPEHWALTHGSASACGVYWLSEGGAQMLRMDDLPASGDTPPMDTASKLLGDLYSQWPIPRGKSWDWRDAIIDTSSEYKTDHDGWVDLTGRARHILAGPFIFLQPGVWNIVMDVEVDVETGVPRFAFQWGGAALENKTLFTTLIRNSGRYQVSLDTKITRPDAAHCMVATDAAQLQGFVRLNSLKLTYVSPLEDDA